MKKLLTELIGTMFLVMTIGLVVASGQPVAVLAIGIILMTMVYMGGHISGAHYNPAVSLAALVAKKFPAKDYGPYVLAQVLGATLGAYFSAALVGTTFGIAPGPGVSVSTAVLAELLFTMALVLVVLNVACAKKMEGSPIYGLAIGGVVMAAAYAAGPISGGAFNPAVGIGATLVDVVMGRGKADNLFIYIVGPVLGALVAAGVFMVQEQEERPA